ncbi:MAG: hypothetical protein MUO61_03495 [Dehalococcoidia bacterium]|nr:hypothetical protein [Dehalococcoidia bacterium]
MYWALLKYHFHISDSDYWKLTPAQLNVLIDRYNQEEEIKNRRTALMCAVYANCHRDPKKKAFTVEDFMPTRKKETQEPKEQTQEQKLFMLQAWQAALGGNK